MAVLGFGSRDTAASGGNYIVFYFIFSYFFQPVSNGRRRGGVPVVGGCKSDWDLHSGFVTRD